MKANAELTPEQQRYKANKAVRISEGQESTCQKCGHLMKRGDLVYRDLVTLKRAHITCKSKKAKPDEPIES